GSPLRIMRLTSAGQAAWHELREGPVASRRTGLLARQLTDAGLVHPLPPGLPALPDATVVIPVRDRAVMLERCLAALEGSYPVVVVDDGSANPAAVAQVAARHGARLIRREVNGGPAAARNTALRCVTSDVIAFIDSDCAASPGWIQRLAAHLADPLVAAVAPRIAGSAAGTWAGQYTSIASSLDLGDRAARVLPRTQVSYVPTAALVARRAALLAAARDGEVFDEGMRIGEDVDLVWRLHEAGWRIRYDPAVQIAHHEPGTWPALLARRYRYGTSAAPLALRHPGAVTHLVLYPWPAATVAAALARRPAAAAAAFTGSVLATFQSLHRADVPAQGTVRAMLGSVSQTWLGAGRYATQFAAPLLVTAIAAPGGRSAGQRWGRRAAAASLLLGPPLAAWAASPLTLDPARFALARIADDVSYGLGVWRGCLSERTISPVRPVIGRHRLRIDAAARQALAAPDARPDKDDNPR
ncbi:MAG TPA: mycofactocin biosynthesis glycosyltransferase MftF, partial [Streptosporangiaceae bacterium]